jgi:predicted ATPase/DNA-binding CsgD family transcriptional regulator
VILPDAVGRNPLTDLIGRDNERSAVRARLLLSRLVTITGPGGIGKTRLALAVADDLSAPVVDVSTITDARLVSSEIATALGLAPGTDASRYEALAVRLDAGSAVLVIDNAEQLDSPRLALAPILDQSPSLRMVVTSRVPIGIPGESEFLLGPLDLKSDPSLGGRDVSPAEQLFLKRARASGAIEVLAPDEAGIVAEICRRLDGMPLAIELAAATLRVLSPSALLKRLADGSAFLSDDQRPSRQRSLDAVVQWSIDAASRPQRSALAAAAVCAGGFDIDALAAIEPRADALHDLDGLLRMGLVQRQRTAGEPRFRLLETVRLAALQCAEVGDSERYTERHARYFADLVRRAGSPLDKPDDAVVPPLLRDRDNIRKAMEWCLSKDQDLALEIAARLGVYWAEVAAADEGLIWVDRALEAHPNGSPMGLHALATRVGLLRSMYADGLDVAAEVLHATSLRSDDRVARRRALAVAAYAMADADPIRGERYLETALTEARASGSRSWVARVQTNRSVLLSRGGDYAAAAAGLREAADAGAEAGEPFTESVALGNLTWALYGLGRTKDALEVAERAVVLIPSGEYPVHRAWLAANLAELQARSDQISAAERSLAEAIRTALEHGGADLLRTVLSSSAIVLSFAADDELAIRASAGARALAARFGIAETSEDAFGEAEEVLARATRRLGNVRARVLAEVGASEDPEALVREVLLRLDEPPAARKPPVAGRIKLQHGELTAREVEIMALLAAGRSDTEIGERLFISPKTASVHVSRIKEKLGVATRLEASLKARDLGLGSKSPKP